MAATNSQLGENKRSLFQNSVGLWGAENVHQPPNSIQSIQTNEYLLGFYFTPDLVLSIPMLQGVIRELLGSPSLSRELDMCTNTKGKSNTCPVSDFLCIEYESCRIPFPNWSPERNKEVWVLRSRNCRISVASSWPYGLEVGASSPPGLLSILCQVRIYLINAFPIGSQSSAQLLEPHCFQLSNMWSSLINNWKTRLL